MSERPNVHSIRLTISRRLVRGYRVNTWPVRGSSGCIVLGRRGVDGERGGLNCGTEPPMEVESYSYQRSSGDWGGGKRITRRHSPFTIHCEVSEVSRCSPFLG
jgi:hypothetical protein